MSGGGFLGVISTEVSVVDDGIPAPARKSTLLDLEVVAG
jgi:hypothetical protein